MTTTMTTTTMTTTTMMMAEDRVDKYLSSGAIPRGEEWGLYDGEEERDSCGVAFLANIDGHADHATVANALEALARMQHRGAVGCEPDTGDGAGILTAIPHAFLAKATGLALPPPGRLAVAFCFLPADAPKRAAVKAELEAMMRSAGLVIITWRTVPNRPEVVGPTARATVPAMEQCLLTAPATVSDSDLERKCFFVRKHATHKISQRNGLYFPSFSTRIVIYKGLLTCSQVNDFYPDLWDEAYVSHVAMVHSRFSTNTFPSWDRAQPNRMSSHNGEINTLKGNLNFMQAREGVIKSDVFSDEEMRCLFPVVEEFGSDSNNLDNVLEFLVVNGRTLPEAMMMLIPEAWQAHASLSPQLRAMFKYNSAVMEPWDGPALFCFTDATRYIGAVLDRNGLRPCRYCLTTDGRILMSSETGVVDLPEEIVSFKGRLNPGRMLLVDFHTHTIVDDAELKSRLAAAHPYQQWLDEHSFTLRDVCEAFPVVPEYPDIPIGEDPRLKAFGYTQETVEMLLIPMLVDYYEALGSMGNDAPLACMSSLPQSVFNYFKQLFAQVTNPPIDPIREEVVMATSCFIGPEGNLLRVQPSLCARLFLEEPILLLSEVESIKIMNYRGWSTCTLDTTFPVKEGSAGLERAIDALCAKATKAVADNFAVIVLSDRQVGSGHAPIPILLALGAVHYHLLGRRERSRVAIVVESGEAREVHHHCLLLGFGADAICPYLVFEIASSLRVHQPLTTDAKGAALTNDAAAAYYKKSVKNGILKVMAKMGISTLQSYKGAQIFEAVGLGKAVMRKCFANAKSRLDGVTFDIIAADYLRLHDLGYPLRDHLRLNVLPNPGDYHWRDGGEAHINDPLAISQLQAAAKLNSKTAYRDFAERANRLVSKCTLRGLLNIKRGRAIPLADVEPAEAIVRRFCTGAMSYGSISLEAHEALAVAMNRIGGKSNTGEGGEDPQRYTATAGADGQMPKRSAIKQVASGRFGVNIHYLTNADEIQIKMAQGAKPGEGGELPGNKVVGKIAECRNSTPGVGLISPPPHHDIYSIEDLAQLIFDLKMTNRRARISVKLVSCSGVGVVAAGVAKAHADHILISGHDGGTGASRWTGIKHAGLPWELGLAEAHQTLVLNNLRGRVVLQTDGQLRTGRDVVYAALLGAEEFGFATAPLIVLGCTMMRKCHLNTCPVGIATQDPVLRAKFQGMPEHVVNYLFMVAEEAREYMAMMGFRTVNEMVGRADMLEPAAAAMNEKSRLINFAPLLTLASKLRPGVATFCQEVQDHRLEVALDSELIRLAQPALSAGVPVHINLQIRNIHRSTGAMLSNEVSLRHGSAGLPLNTISVKLVGHGGQAFGCWAVAGLTLELEGDANDYVGKGLSGGRIIIYPSRTSNIRNKSDSVIIGNVCLYGAISGELFARGMAAERFAVRNSGATAVCEGVGDNGCEYMTGGRVVILGPTGRNFAAGMSGGIAYVFDKGKRFRDNCNMKDVEIERVDDPDDVHFLRERIALHHQLTNSDVAGWILQHWDAALPLFAKVMPIDYKRVLMETKKAAAAAAAAAVSSSSSTLSNNSSSTTTTTTTMTKAAGKGAGTPCSTCEQNPTAAAAATTAAIVKADGGSGGGGKSASYDKVRGFIMYEAKPEPYRDVAERLGDYDELYTKHSYDEDLNKQAARCMDCGVPFCQADHGCPLGNLIPTWNNLVHKHKWKEAYIRLTETNPFPEFTGRVCPAPCQGSCVLGINNDPVTIKNIENSIIDYAFEKGWVQPRRPTALTNKRVAIIGSGPAGLAAAEALNAAGHSCTVYERSDRIGGLLYYGIPNMKLSKAVVERRIDVLAKSGIAFRVNAEVGKNVAAKDMLQYDAVVLACGAARPRNLPIPGRELQGIHYAMDYLHQTTAELVTTSSTRANATAKRYVGHLAGQRAENISAKGKHVVVIGGGDTGCDCIGTALRQGCKSVVNFELLDKKPNARAKYNPWPQYPQVFKVDYGHEEAEKMFGKDPREYCVLSTGFVDDGAGNVKGINTIRVQWETDGVAAGQPPRMKQVPGSEQFFPADLVLIAMGFVGPDADPIANTLDVRMDPRGNFAAAPGSYKTSNARVFACGDCRRGQSLVVWAIHEGRQCARNVDGFLMGGKTVLPGPGGMPAFNRNFDLSF